ncbi:class I SAM-dependent methyltransferase, partial [Ahrensia marina]|uniref:class I SAM-dependent methyltransferase n=1 Tax=Ahrensia marina TaxID=1514904 RepID=UPI0009E84A87
MKQKSACNKWLCLDSQFESDLLNPNLATSPWSGHRQFAFDLMVFMQPQVVVELGTHYGCSFFAFLQAAKDFDLDVSIYAIDSWVGDEHAGFYGDDVFDLVKTIVFQHFKSQNAVMLRKRFDEALSDIQDGCINLLHIDGLHTYDAVKHDFETWLPKLAKDGVVLFHDIAPDTGYGSAKYWSEIKHKFPHYEFLHHSWGLGVLFPKGDLWHHEINNGNHSGWLNIYRYQAESKLLKKQLLSAEAMIDDRDKAIQSQTTMIDDRD